MVEDNEVNKMVASRILLNEMANVITASDGYEAIDKLKSNTFDIILMDIQMPRLDGYSVIKFIRTELILSTEKLPVIAVTAHASKGEKDKAIASGFNEVVTKPFKKSEIIRAILRYINEK
ncbi:MAG: response regulator [Candidatus Dojkabacteria bacterium]|nr:response regulator [Candidatus Dojkabacteria bacterium]